MENSEVYDQMEGALITRLEDRIKAIIVKIKSKRSRPRYHNILTHINRGNCDDKLVMEDLLVILKGMV